eukprot:snap_masked-scaffold_4-processed-gene-9.4-mRNA-1 protein AED:1.00 eAED:1.00 QI:0/0/0/0/1/1/2/0/68
MLMFNMNTEKNFGLAEILGTHKLFHHTHKVMLSEVNITCKITDVNIRNLMVQVVLLLKTSLNNPDDVK